MRFNLKTAFSILLVFGLFQHPMVRAQPLTLIYSGNMDGELEPCGCSDQGNFGGIKRRVTILDALRKENPALIAISAGGLLSSDGPGDHLKSKYILKGFQALNYDAIGLQWRDLVYGMKFISKDALPWVASNWADAAIPPYRQVERIVDGKNITLRLFTWLDPDRSPMRQMAGQHSLVHEDVKKLSAALHQAKKAGVLTVLTTTQPLDRVQSLLPLEQIDILLVKAAYEIFGEPKIVGRTLVLQPGSRGMRIARLDLSLNSAGGIGRWTHQVVPMPESVADSPRMANWYDEYNAKVKQDYLKRVAIRKKRQSGESDYMGEEQCKICHPAQHKIWQDSEHAIAFEDLEAVNKAFDPACIRCHTVGFDQPGGFVDINITPHLMGVQCENCHGPSRQHVKSAGKQPVANAQWSREKVCRQCHIQKHSPTFKFETYWPKIAH